jgi:hypothetical protein
MSNSNVYLKILEYLFLKYYKIVKVNGEKNKVELLDKNILFIIKVLCPIFTLRGIVVIYCIFSYYFNYKDFFDKLELKYKQEERYSMVYPDLDEAIAKNWLIIQDDDAKIMYYITKIGNFKNLMGKISLEMLYKSIDPLNIEVKIFFIKNIQRKLIYSNEFVRRFIHPEIQFSNIFQIYKSKH